MLWKLNTSAADKGFGMNGSVKEYQSRKDMHGKSYNLAVDPSYDPSTIESQLSPEQLQLFTSENSTLLNHYNDTLYKATRREVNSRDSYFAANARITSQRKVR